MAWIPRCCGSGVGWRLQVPIRPLAWEPPYAVGAAQEMAKRQKKNSIKKMKILKKKKKKRKSSNHKEETREEDRNREEIEKRPE